MCHILIYIAKLTNKSYKVSTANSNYVRYTCSKTPCEEKGIRLLGIFIPALPDSPRRLLLFRCGNLQRYAFPESFPSSPDARCPKIDFSPFLPILSFPLFRPCGSFLNYFIHSWPFFKAVVRDQ